MLRCPRRLLVLLLLLAALPLQARTRAVQHVQPAVDAPPQDIFSHARPSEARTTHLSLDLTVDFDSRTFRGTATHTIRNFTGTRKFVLDSEDLDISGVTADGQPTTWALGAADPALAGAPLTIDILPTTRQVRIAYSTRPSAAAVHWLTPEQTVGRASPMMYTENEPDMARSWIPVQDTPGVRMTWDATLHVPSTLLAVMSAPNPVAIEPGGIYTFSMETTVPAYLIAAAVGRFEFHAVGSRTGFYAEPESVGAATRELQYLPGMFDAAERVIGTYPWSRYDLLLAPPGFVAGGMENPMLTFINIATAIPGNLDYPPLPSGTVAHELAHTWWGDLVTCATWRDTWLNEGFATYYEKRILEEMTGPERPELGFFNDRRSYSTFMDSVGRTSPLTVLHRSFQPGDGPNVFNTTSYQKGGLFLKTLEDSLGRDAFDRFASYYLAHNTEHWADELALLEALRATALTGRPDMEQQLMLQEWIYGTGLPPNATAPTSSAVFNRVATEANAYRSGQSLASLNTSGWTELELNLFLQMITDIIPQHMAELDLRFGLTRMNSPSIHWWLAVATTRWAPAVPALEAYLMRGGWNVISIYNRLASTPAGFSYAQSIYASARPHYVPEIRASVDVILNFQAKAA